MTTDPDRTWPAARRRFRLLAAFAGLALVAASWAQAQGRAAAATRGGRPWIISGASPMSHEMLASLQGLLGTESGRRVTERSPILRVVARLDASSDAHLRLAGAMGLGRGVRALLPVLGRMPDSSAAARALEAVRASLERAGWEELLEASVRARAHELAGALQRGELESDALAEETRELEAFSEHARLAGLVASLHFLAREYRAEGVLARARETAAGLARDAPPQHPERESVETSFRDAPGAAPGSGRPSVLGARSADLEALLASMVRGRTRTGREGALKAGEPALPELLRRLEELRVEGLDQLAQRNLLGTLAAEYASEPDPDRAGRLQSALLSAARRAYPAEHARAIDRVIAFAGHAAAGNPVAHRSRMAQAVADLAIGSESRQVRRSAVASLLAWEASERSPEVRAGLSTALSRIADFERARAESFEPSPPRAQPPPKRSWSWEAVFARAGLAAGALLSGGLAALLGATLTLALVGGFAWILGQLAGRLWRSESGVPEAAPGTGAILAALIPYGGVAIALLVSSPPSDALRLLPWVAGAGVGLGVLARTSLLDKLDADNRFIEAWLLSLVLPLAGLAVAGYQGGKAVGRALDRTAAATATPEPAPTAPPVATGVPAAAVNPAAPLKGLSMLVRSLLERPAWKDPWRAAGDLSDGAALAFMDPTVRPATAVLRRAVVASPDVDPAFWAKVSRSFDEPLAAALRRFADRVRGDPSSVGFLGMIQAYSREEHGLVGRTLRSAQDRTTRQALDRDVVLRLLASLDGSRRNRARNRRASNLATARALDRLDNVNVESLEPSTQRLLLAGLALAYAAEDEPFRARGLSAVLLSVSRRALLAERESALRLMLTAAESAPPGPPGLGRKLRAAQAAAGLAISGESAELRLAAAQALSAWERREHSENVRKGLASALSRIQDLETALAEASRPRPAQ